MSVNPTSLSMDHSPSPAPETPEPGPSRKRPRTTSTSAEDRKEARAHRNRIAAQNSRDRRKAQFSYLERRVSELEEENRQLRAGLAVPPPRPDQLKAEEQERERAKERENEELRERIKTLEKGWDAVMKALAAQGLSTGTALPAASQPATDSNPTPAAPEPSTKQQPADSPSPTFPALEPTMTFPISPAPSHTSLDFDLDHLSSSSSTGGVHWGSVPDGPAAGGLDLSLALTGVTSPDDSSATSEENAIDDATMEDLFREILAPSPRLTATGLPFDAQGSSHFEASSAGTSPPAPFAPQVTADGILGLEGLVGTGAGGAGGDAGSWPNELEVDMLEMDRILELLPAADAAAFPQTLEDLGLGLSWGEVENITAGGGDRARWCVLRTAAAHNKSHPD
ncbi:BZIP domain-containing protein [Mycena venus]|uniref:X-box-binding protein 1 n=1 Tax=Mycena venus TaxID=2733690 RepID=A0A8H6YI41_9AGAR|nr:BZIP domain-containing protein [Mycena venus]